MLREHQVNRTRKFRRYAISWLFVCLYFVFLLLDSPDVNLKLIGLLTIAISILSVYEVKDNFNLFAVYAVVAYCNYSFIMVNYINTSFQSFFTSFRGDSVSNLGLHILFAFSLILYLFSPFKIQKTRSEDNFLIRNKPKKALPITAVIVAMLLYILMVGFGRPEFAGLRGSPSPMYEYSIILFIVGFHFVGSNKLSRLVLTVVLVLFSLQNFIFGGRVIGLQLIIAYIVLFYSHKLTIRKIAPYALLGLVMLSLIGIERGGFALSVDGMRVAWEQIKMQAFALDTAYAAYYASLTFLKVEEILYLQDRIALFIKFLFSIVAGGRIPDSNLSVFTKHFFPHYGGGVFPFYFHFFLGWFGLILGALVVRSYSRIINNVSLSNSGFAKCLSVYVVATTFRWYLYTPLIILRGVLFLAIAYYGINVVYNLNNSD